MTILVICATSRVGGHVVEQLVARNAKVRILTRDDSRANFPIDVEVAQGEILDLDSLRNALKGVRTLFLLNAVTGDEFTPVIIILNMLTKLASGALSTCPSSMRIVSSTSRTSR